MKTAEEFIVELKSLPIIEKQKIADFLLSDQNIFVENESYSEQDRTTLDQIQSEALNGVNTSGPFRNAEDLFSHLNS
ncbi:MAG: hypothetical protein P9L94_00615 [Candidatus Hinthialibacter antarcticus]|nr:hypothetical protein [Candidatus Hinthialibacter antarcticus]